MSGMVYIIYNTGMAHIKEPLLLIEKSHLVAAAGFLSDYLSSVYLMFHAI